MESKTFYIAEVDGDTSFQDQTVTARVPMLTFVNEEGIILAEIPNDNTFMEYNKTGKLQRNEFDLILKTKVFWEGDNLLLKIIVRNNEGVTATGVAVELPNEGYTILNKEENITIDTRYNPHTWEIGNLREEEEASLTLIIDPIKFKEREIKILSTSTDSSIEGNPDNNRREIFDRVFVIKTTQFSFDSKVPSAGITEIQARETENFIKQNKDFPERFTPDCIAFKNTVEIEAEKEIRQAMINIANRDNGSEPSNYREYGSYISKKKYIGEVFEGPLSKTEDSKRIISEAYKKGKTIPKITANVIIDTDFNTKGIFHTHQSYEYKFTIEKGNNKKIITDNFDQAPSDIDINNCRYEVNYVFAMRTKLVYMYNNIGVLAILPLNNFVNFRTL